MNAEQRTLMIERHRARYQAYGYASESLFWQSRGIQKARFKVLSEIGIRAGDSLLDVGCGFADLSSWLDGCGLPVVYTGIDLSQDILQQGMRLNPELNLCSGELFDFDWQAQSFDWVVLSGTLNWNLHDDGEYARRVIARMFELCRCGVAFNMLDVHGCDRKLLGDLRAYPPQDILKYCQRFSTHCQLRTDYLDNDFTVYMQRP